MSPLASSKMRYSTTQPSIEALPPPIARTTRDIFFSMHSWRTCLSNRKALVRLFNSVAGSEDLIADV